MNKKNYLQGLRFERGIKRESSQDESSSIFISRAFQLNYAPNRKLNETKGAFTFPPNSMDFRGYLKIKEAPHPKSPRKMFLKDTRALPLSCKVMFCCVREKVEGNWVREGDICARGLRFVHTFSSQFYFRSTMVKTWNLFAKITFLF